MERTRHCNTLNHLTIICRLYGKKPKFRTEFLILDHIPITTSCTSALDLKLLVTRTKTTKDKWFSATYVNTGKYPLSMDHEMLLPLVNN